MFKPCEYLLTIPVEPMPAGQTYTKGYSLPLHCTVMHWFTLSNKIPPSALNSFLQKCCGEFASAKIELFSVSPALFGKNSDTPVNVLKRNSNLCLLHTKILVFLAGGYCAPKELAWCGAGYNPHVTSVQGHEFATGSTHRARRLVLVGRDGSGNKMILWGGPLCT